MSAELNEMSTAATVTGLPTAAGKPLLTFAFAKRNGVLVQTITDGVAETVYRVGATPSSIA